MSCSLTESQRQAAGGVADRRRASAWTMKRAMYASSASSLCAASRLVFRETRLLKRSNFFR